MHMQTHITYPVGTVVARVYIMETANVFRVKFQITFSEAWLN